MTCTFELCNIFAEDELCVTCWFWFRIKAKVVDTIRNIIPHYHTDLRIALHWMRNTCFWSEMQKCCEKVLKKKNELPYTILLSKL